MRKKQGVAYVQRVAKHTCIEKAEGCTKTTMGVWKRRQERGRVKCPACAAGRPRS